MNDNTVCVTSTSSSSSFVSMISHAPSSATASSSAALMALMSPTSAVLFVLAGSTSKLSQGTLRMRPSMPLARRRYVGMDTITSSSPFEGKPRYCRCANESSEPRCRKRCRSKRAEVLSALLVSATTAPLVTAAALSVGPPSSGDCEGGSTSLVKEKSDVSPTATPMSSSYGVDTKPPCEPRAAYSCCDSERPVSVGISFSMTNSSNTLSRSDGDTPRTCPSSCSYVRPRLLKKTSVPPNCQMASRSGLVTQAVCLTSGAIDSDASARSRRRTVVHSGGVPPPLYTARIGTPFSCCTLKLADCSSISAATAMSTMKEIDSAYITIVLRLRSRCPVRFLTVSCRMNGRSQKSHRYTVTRSNMPCRLSARPTRPARSPMRIQRKILKKRERLSESSESGRR
mmetsp:Transcript_28004/g.96803  ORF Transcript_28004/g.96803 Transcript_28004/m.96803 type:complete len:399 (-) Transcript_28004:1730-2926(-)